MGVLGKAGLKERAGADWPPRHRRLIQLQRAGSSEKTPGAHWPEPNPAHPALPLATAGDLISHWPRNGGGGADSPRPQPAPGCCQSPADHAPSLSQPPPAQTHGSVSSSFIKTQSHNPANEVGPPPSRGSQAFRPLSLSSCRAGGGGGFENNPSTLITPMGRRHAPDPAPENSRTAQRQIRPEQPLGGGGASPGWRPGSVALVARTVEGALGGSQVAAGVDEEGAGHQHPHPVQPHEVAPKVEGPRVAVGPTCPSLRGEVQHVPIELTCVWEGRCRRGEPGGSGDAGGLPLTPLP